MDSSKKVLVTRVIPELGIRMLREKGYQVDVLTSEELLPKNVFIDTLRAKPYDAVLCLLTDAIDAAVFDVAPQAKIFANYAVGFNNVDIEEAKKRGIVVTNTPGVLTDSVAEHAMALMLALSCRIVEGDKFTREGKYKGWDPMLLLGTDLKDKTLGILGAGRIGEQLLHHASRGFGMHVIYYDVHRVEFVEKEYGATYYPTVEQVLKESDFVSIHVPLLDSTKHLINAERLSLMKKTAYLVNTSRGPVIDEVALVEALKKGIIKGAGLDVFENEPKLAPGLVDLPSVVLTPHIASATVETRGLMSEMAASNIIEVLEGRKALNPIY